ncbi:unnamed protein product [Cuscuta campestris]|uniref:Uncharacterized protein n=1 Tax=Cuscuta campestris TaxID=132261 RepID=A0A484NDH1_9ASTE|nr:unnamed protein product [Cuscuta campestris]
MANNANRVVFIDLTISDSSSDSSSLAFPSLGAPTPELSSGLSLASEQSVTSPLPREENHPHLPEQVSGGVLPGSGVLPNGARTEVSSGCPGTSHPQKIRNPQSGASRLVSGARPSSQGSPSPQQSYGQPPEEWGDYDMGGNDDFSASLAQSNDMAGLSPSEFSRLHPAPRLPAPSPPSPPRLPSGKINWDSMTLQDFALYQRMRRAKLEHSLPTVEAEPSRESRTASPNLLRSLNDGSSLEHQLPVLGPRKTMTYGKLLIPLRAPRRKEGAHGKGRHLLFVDCMDAIGPPSVPSPLPIKFLFLVLFQEAFTCLVQEFFLRPILRNVLQFQSRI